MPFARTFALLSLFLLAAAPAGAVTEADFCASGADPCEFKGNPLTVSADTMLDFGGRTLIIGSSREINITGGVILTVKAGSFVMRPGAHIHNAETASGAGLVVTTAHEITLEKGLLGSLSRIEVPGTESGGSVQLTAGGNVVIDGELRANCTTLDGLGGFIDIDAGGAVTLTGTINVTSGDAGSGGEVIVGADGPIVVNGPIDASSGFDGGSIELSTNASLSTTGTLDVRGTSGGSLGGSVLLDAGGSVTIGGNIFAQAAGTVAGGGGFGSEDFEVNAGASIFINDSIDVSGGAPEGSGGAVSFAADVDIIQKAPVFAVGAGGGGIGGEIDYLAGRLVSLEAPNDVSGNDVGGDFTANGRNEIQAKADIIANGDLTAGSAGLIILDGIALDPHQVSGNVVVSGALRTRGDAAVVGSGGAITIRGCDVTVAAPGILNNFGDQANNLIQSSGLMTVAGQVQAKPAGTNALEFLDPNKQPVITGTIDPATTPVRKATLFSCQPPVPPVCGDGDPTGIEGCDDGNLDSCDGCSGAAAGKTGANCHASGCCQVEACGNGVKECSEVCDDGNTVDGDGCDSNCTPTGCGNGRVTEGEECDDGNTTAGDGCGATCLVEPPPGCGNGMVDNGEQCDDGNNVNCDGCSKICITEACGNGVKECNEVCDDGGTLACDGDCAADCSRPADVCGDRITECGEQCDAGDANGAPASACSPFCQTCAIGSGADCPCATDFDCAPTGRCGGLACVDGACSSVALPCPANDGNDCNGVETCVNNGECKTVTAASCIDDGDPCTDETCNVVGGCTRLPRSGIPGVSCRLDDIESAAGSASIGDLPTKLRAKILKFSGAAKTRLTSAAQETSVKRQRKLLKAAAAQLAKLLKVIAKGLKKHQISEVLGTRLHEQADGARGAVQTLRAGLTG